MGLIKFEEKEYDFKWESILLMALAAPLLAYLLFTLVDWRWLHEFTSNLTVDSLNVLMGGNNFVDCAEDLTSSSQPCSITMFRTEDGSKRGTIHFETMCTGIHAILIFITVILFIPHSKSPLTSYNIWYRKIKAIIITSTLFYIVNVFRMWLQLYLYATGIPWEKIHYSISSASSIVAVACIFVIHKYVPEFIMSLLWIGDETKSKLNKLDKEEVEEEGEGEVTNDKIDKESIQNAIDDDVKSSLNLNGKILREELLNRKTKLEEIIEKPVKKSVNLFIIILTLNFIFYPNSLYFLAPILIAICYFFFAKRYANDILNNTQLKLEKITISNYEIKVNIPLMMIGILWVIIVGVIYVGGLLYVDSFMFGIIMLPVVSLYVEYFVLGMIMLPGFLMISSSTKKSQQKKYERKISYFE